MVEITPIKVGRRVNDGTGDDLRTASTKSNANFSTVKAAVEDIAAAAAAAVVASGEAAQAAAQVGPLGLRLDFVDTTLIAKASIGHTAAPDADYQALVTDVQIGFLALSAPHTVTLPDVDAYPIGQLLFIADESGQCSSVRPITIQVGAASNDTIAGQQAIQIADAYQGIGLRRGASNVWIIAR